jgi:SAM-dependent methyltransferase
MESRVSENITTTKSLEGLDYAGLGEYVHKLAWALEWFHGWVRLGHNNRLWEYAQALNAWGKQMPEGQPVLDVGCGPGLLGPAIVLNYPRQEVVEIDPDLPKRPRIPFLESVKCTLEDACQVDELCDKAFEAVFAISVIEHVDDDATFLSDLAEWVAPGGLLFLTTDVTDRPDEPHRHDCLRKRIYTPDTIRVLVEGLEGFDFPEDPDWAYHGDTVHDYSFFSVAMVKA